MLFVGDFWVLGFSRFFFQFSGRHTEQKFVEDVMSAQQILGFRCGSEWVLHDGISSAFCSTMGRTKSPKVRLFPLGDSGLANTSELRLPVSS